MLDVRSDSEFCKSHILCAVSAPSGDGHDTHQLFRRILQHDDIYGWCLQHPFVIVYDESTSERVKWLVDVLTDAVAARAGLDGFDGADRSEQLLRRLSFQCKEILLLPHQRFADEFGFCCMAGDEWGAASVFERLGPLPRCALLQPPVFLAGRQVTLSEDMLRTLGITHVVVNGDFWDVMDGTSGGGSQRPFQTRHADVPGICYLKCDIPDREEDDNLLQVLEGTASFLQQCAAHGGRALVCMHGQSRSAAVVCAFVMESSSKSVNEAWEIFQEAHIQTDSNLIWWSSLQQLHKRHKKRFIVDGLPEAQRCRTAAIEDA